MGGESTNFNNQNEHSIQGPDTKLLLHQKIVLLSHVT